MVHVWTSGKTYHVGTQMIQLAVLCTKNKAERTKKCQISFHFCPDSPILPSNGPLLMFCEIYQVDTQTAEFANVCAKNKVELVV